MTSSAAALAGAVPEKPENASALRPGTPPGLSWVRSAPSGATGKDGPAHWTPPPPPQQLHFGKWCLFSAAFCLARLPAHLLLFDPATRPCPPTAPENISVVGRLPNGCIRPRRGDRCAQTVWGGAVRGVIVPRKPDRWQFSASESCRPKGVGGGRRCRQRAMVASGGGVTELHRIVALFTNGGALLSIWKKKWCPYLKQRCMHTLSSRMYMRASD